MDVFSSATLIKKARALTDPNPGLKSHCEGLIVIGAIAISRRVVILKACGGAGNYSSQKIPLV